MEILYPCCAGLDVHKDTVVVCLRRVSAAGQVRKQIRTFGTMTGQLLALVDWLVAEGVTHAAMESTGVYWKPLFNLLEGRVQVILVNAQHIKQVPGRKTDVKDCEWLAQLLQHGLLKASFVPPRPTRELRDLTRQRTQLVRQTASVANRIQKILEDANIKLGSVASDVLGESGRDMLRALIAGETDPEKLAELARKRLRAKIPALRLALQGRVSDHHRFLLQLQLDQLQSLEDLIGRLNARIEAALASCAEAVELLQTIPGVSQRVAETVLAEIGTQMEQFPTVAHLASWAGLCPGNDESAGKRRSGRTTKGSRWLRGMLVQAAWAASHTKDSYLAAQYRRLARRKGRKRALIAVGHTLLVIIYHVLKKGLPYHELGGDYLDRREPERLTRQLVKRLEQLGHQVTLNAQPT
ncbi:MAG TPA: IS110 family transposase [Candidatus Methylomirabilis sp.]|nr:IS110 family transposase [Candidatus Methylomirabilis sp.]